MLLVLTANRGLCGGYNSNVQRAGRGPLARAAANGAARRAGSVGQAGHRRVAFSRDDADETFTHFEDKPSFAEVDVLANRYLQDYAAGRLDRLDVAYMRFESVSRQSVAVETLLPLGSLAAACDERPRRPGKQAGTRRQPARSDTNFCRRPRAFWKKWCRPASR